ncbi:MAG: 5'-3' exonuclease [Longimicrobiales bacterium]
MIVHLLDGTYELFRHFYGQRRATSGSKPGSDTGRENDGLPREHPLGAVRGVLFTVLQMIDTGATHLGVATDHIIESFRNRLWPDYKTGAGIDPALWAQFEPLEEALAAMGVVVWPMVELEADDALASAAALAAADERVEKVCIWTPDKDLAQCVRDQRVVQVDRRSGQIRDAAGVQARFGVPPSSIPDYLALVGDSADGYPGIAGFGAKSAAAVLSRFGTIEAIPADSAEWRANVMNSATLARRLQEQRELALRFKTLATLRTDAPLFNNVDALRWTGATAAFPAWAARLDAPDLVNRARAARSKLTH